MKNVKTLISHQHFRELGQDFYQPTPPTPLKGAKLATYSSGCCHLLGLDPGFFSAPHCVTALNGNYSQLGAQSLAMKYTGHQFGVYNPDLGDGRGLLLGERRHRGELWDIHVKGAGKTPYSRFGDGRAVLRSTVREYLCSEAMAGLGIPTTRALCIVSSDEPVMRETEERGALLVRVARTHVRFGHFEYFHYSKQPHNVKKLADYLISRHFPPWQHAQDRYQRFFQQVVTSTAELIAHWQAVGFNHGVMNTDNMSILGDTFDYGPFAFLDGFDPHFTCNHSDYQGRYRFDRQPSIGLWNLNALAQALSSLLDRDSLIAALEDYEPRLLSHYHDLMKKKLGLFADHGGDQQLLNQLLQLLASEKTDYTVFFRQLCGFATDGHNAALGDLFIDRDRFTGWADKYRQRLALETLPEQQRQQAMKRSNPKYILRTHLAQQAIEQAEQGDFSQVETLRQLLSQPFAEQPQRQDYAALPPAWASGITLSCSS